MEIWETSLGDYFIKMFHEDVLLNLPGGWKKRFVQRRKGASAGKWDIYHHPPGGGKRLKSEPDLRR
jgi:hypothetical protein